MEIIHASSDAADPVLREIYKCEHIFRSLGCEYTFAKCGELPLIVRAPLRIPVDSPFVCLFGNPLTKTLNFASLTVERLQQTTLSRKGSERMTLDEVRSVETVAHFFRHSAILEADAEERRSLFKRAVVLYKAALFACDIKGMKEILNGPNMGTKLLQFAPIPNVHAVDPEVRRRLSHCLAGIAMCQLLANGYSLDFFCLSSAALTMDPEPLEMANVFRIYFLLSSDHVRRMFPGNEYTVLDHESSEMVPYVYRNLNEALVLPLVHGAIALEEQRLFYSQDEWEQVGCVRGDVFGAADLFSAGQGAVSRTGPQGHQDASRADCRASFAAASRLRLLRHLGDDHVRPSVLSLLGVPRCNLLHQGLPDCRVEGAQEGVQEEVTLILGADGVGHIVARQARSQ